MIQGPVALTVPQIYIYIYIYIYIWLRRAQVDYCIYHYLHHHFCHFVWTIGPMLWFLDRFATYSRTPLTSSQLVARPVCTYTGQRNVERPRTNILALSWIRTHAPVYERSRPRGHRISNVSINLVKYQNWKCAYFLTA
jgi:hypothetical protein